MPWRQQNNPTALERVMAVLSYLTAGLAGIIYIILSRSSYQSSFFRFHFLQSIILGIMSILLGWATRTFGGMSEPFFTFLDGLFPSVGGMMANGIVWLLNLILMAFALLPFYGLVFAALGKYAEIPFISNVVRQQIR